MRDDTVAWMRQQMDKLYEEIPDIPDCDGSCWYSCTTPVTMTEIELLRMAQARPTAQLISEEDEEGYQHVRPTQIVEGEDACRMLEYDTKQCSIYEDRPAICRLWGTFEGHPCSRGCKPTTLVTDEHAAAILLRLRYLETRVKAREVQVG